jgi:hypothetical protein
LSVIAFGWFANRIQLLAVISYTGVLRFTVAFDAQHHASVKNIGKSKTEVDE